MASTVETETREASMKKGSVIKVELVTRWARREVMIKLHKLHPLCASQTVMGSVSNLLDKSSRNRMETARWPH